MLSLARERLRSTTAGRIGRLLGWLMAVVFSVIALVLRLGDSADISLGGLLSTAARWIAWGAGAPLAIAAAAPRAAIDRAEGIEALAASRGVPRPALEALRSVAAMSQTSLAIGAPLFVLSLVSVASAGSAVVALRHALLGVGLVAFSAIAGVTVGGIAAACGRAGAARGRSLLAAIIFLPWVLSDLFGFRAWSIPGALSAALDFLVRASGLGGAGV